jgi:Tn3 transposase DDE domain
VGFSVTEDIRFSTVKSGCSEIHPRQQTRPLPEALTVFSVPPLPNTGVHACSGFADRFVHLRSGAAPEDSVALMTAVLADATNLGLARMARSCGIFSHSKLLWTAEWHIRDETYQAGRACLVEAIHAQPFTAIWGDGDTSSSDGQFFRAGGHGEARADHNARCGSEPGVKFYTHISDRYAPFHTKVIAANTSEALNVLDGLLHHESSLAIKEHYTDTGGPPHMYSVFAMRSDSGLLHASVILPIADSMLPMAGLTMVCSSRWSAA